MNVQNYVNRIHALLYDNSTRMNIAPKDPLEGQAFVDIYNMVRAHRKDGNELLAIQLAASYIEATKTISVLLLLEVAKSVLCLGHFRPAFMLVLLAETIIRALRGEYSPETLEIKKFRKKIAETADKLSRYASKTSLSEEEQQIITEELYSFIAPFALTNFYYFPITDPTELLWELKELHFIVQDAYNTIGNVL